MIPGLVCALALSMPHRCVNDPQTIFLRRNDRDRRFDGIGLVNGGGATSVLLKDYPEPQRSQILDLVYKPKFGASVSALLVEVPGDGNSTQGSMPSHMHTRDDLDYTRGYTWWILREAKRRNPRLSLDATAWSAPGWVGNGQFWSQDAADYYVEWLRGLRDVYGLRLDAIGCRNEKGESLEFAKLLRRTLNANGFGSLRLHAFDDWTPSKLDFVARIETDPEARAAIDIFGAHTLKESPASPEVRAAAARMGKPIWNTEEHVYLKGFDAAISIVKAFNDNYIRSGATKIVNWYDIAGVYPIEPYSEDPAAILARSPWSGHYAVREALWGYAHYGQFTEIGWKYLDGGCVRLDGGGSAVSLASSKGEYSVVLETKGAKAPQRIAFRVENGLSAKRLCVWRSDARAQFVRQPDLVPEKGGFSLSVDPDAVYSISTTTGQRKGSFGNVPADSPFPFPYRETFEGYGDPRRWGRLPRYTADIGGAFELAERPDGKGACLRQAVPAATISWAPEWLPYTILGDEKWRDYEASADVRLAAGETAGVMARVNHVGTGYGYVPKGYVLRLGSDGRCRLTVSRGPRDPGRVVGDAEQQALIKAGKFEGQGGEKELGSVRIEGVGPNEWHRLSLRCLGSRITGMVDGKPVVEIDDSLYESGMAGFLADEAGRGGFSAPFFDDLTVKAVGAPDPAPFFPPKGTTVLYRRKG